MNSLSAHIRYTKEAVGVSVIELDRVDKLNAMTRAMYAAIAQSLRQAAADPEVRVVLMRGRGPAFCSGQDTEQINVAGDLDTTELVACLNAVIDFPKPLVAAIHGHAVGFGGSILGHCDLVVSTHDCAVIYPFTKLGICPAFASSHTMVQTLGRQRAAQALLLGERLTGERLHAWGLVTHLAESRDEAHRVAHELCSKIARRRPAAVQATRDLITRSSGAPDALRATSEAEMWRFDRLLRTRAQDPRARDRASDDGGVYDPQLDELYRAAVAVRDQDLSTQRAWCQSLFRQLADMRQRMGRGDWRQLCKALQAHALGRMLRAGDPLTARAYDKPRGYPGDAALLDMMYGVTEVPQPSWPALSQITLESDASRALVARAELVRERLDALAAERGSFDALTIAGGHVREVEGCEAFIEGRVRVTSLDLDPESVAVVEREKPQINVIHADILRDFVASPAPASPSFDFAWAMGIYDYLDGARARALTRATWRRLRPGGSYLIANYTPRCVSVGYGESVMAWYLHLRETGDMTKIVRDLPAHEIAELRVQTCLEGGPMLTLEVVKAHASK